MAITYSPLWAGGEKSRGYLLEALLILMERTPYPKITVSDVARRAGVSRTSFYRHFPTKESIIVDYFDHMFQEYLERIGPTPPDLRFCAQLFFTYIDQHQELLRILILHGLGALVEERLGVYLTRLLEAVVRSPEPLPPLKKAFLVGGSIALLGQWVRDGGRQDATELLVVVESFDLYRSLGAVERPENVTHPTSNVP